VAKIQIKVHAPLQCAARFAAPFAVTISPTGELFASRVQHGVSHIVEIDRRGKERAGQLHELDIRGADGVPLRLVFVSGISAAGKGRLVICDAGREMVFVCTRRPRPAQHWVVEETIGGGEESGAEDGEFARARFRNPHGVCEILGASSARDSIIVADTGHPVIRRISMLSRRVFIVAGSFGVSGYCDGAGEKSLFFSPFDVAVSDSGIVYASDMENHRVRRIVLDDEGGADVTTFAGSGSAGVCDGAAASAAFHYPTGIAMEGETVYVTDGEGQTLRIICNVVEMLTWLKFMLKLRYTFTCTKMKDTERIENMCYVEEMLNHWEDSRSNATGVSVNGMNGNHGLPGSESRRSLHLNYASLRVVHSKIDYSNGFKLNVTAFGTLTLEQLFGVTHSLTGLKTYCLVDFDYVKCKIEYLAMAKACGTPYKKFGV